MFGPGVLQRCRSFSPVDGVGQSRSFAKLLVVVLRRARTVMGALKDSTLVTKLHGVVRLGLEGELDSAHDFAWVENRFSPAWRVAARAVETLPLHLVKSRQRLTSLSCRFTYLWCLFNFRIGRITYSFRILFIDTCTPLCQWRRSPSLSRRGSVPSFSRSRTATRGTFPLVRCTKV